MALFTFPSRLSSFWASPSHRRHRRLRFVEPIPEARVRPRAPQLEIVSATGIAASLTVAAPRPRNRRTHDYAARNFDIVDAMNLAMTSI
jgi:hypothetical protein